MSAFLRIERMLITRGANVLYDEPFHPGVNIIHGSNGSGKSTLADFIYFGLGGDLREWKESASRAERVYLQILTPAGTLTLRRDVSTDGLRPMAIYFGNMDDALSSPNDGWQLLGYKRPEHGYSFSQVLFRAIGLPESVSDGASNITMHQLLRLLYVDQLTPVQRIFRIENFDTWQTRQAVGDLLTGVGGYDLYEKQIALRETRSNMRLQRRRIAASSPSHQAMAKTSSSSIFRPRARNWKPSARNCWIPSAILLTNPSLARIRMR